MTTFEITECLRNLWHQGKASGAATPVDFEAARREAQMRLANAKTK
jgi:hypothetical protein